MPPVLGGRYSLQLRLQLQMTHHNSYLTANLLEQNLMNLRLHRCCNLRVRNQPVVELPRRRAQEFQVKSLGPLETWGRTQTMRTGTARTATMSR